VKLYLDPGHGGSDPGAVGNGLKEKDITLDIAKRIQAILASNYKQVDIKMSRTKDVTKSLQHRSNDANNWRADYFISIHCNAFDGNAHGYEDFIYKGLANTSETAGYQQIMHQEIAKVNELTNRGKKKANFHVLRETAMPAFLSENGFIDNQNDAGKIKQADWREKIALGHANGIAKAFHLERKQTAQADHHTYQVIAGSFKRKSYAQRQVNLLQSKGFEALIDTATISGERWYRVQAGSFSSRNNAKRHLQTIDKAGVDGFIFTK